MGAPQPALCKFKQQTKGVAIRVDRVRADFALSDQAPSEEGFQQRRKVDRRAFRAWPEAIAYV
jgi:hypothetical protein